MVYVSEAFVNARADECVFSTRVPASLRFLEEHLPTATQCARFRKLRNENMGEGST